MITAEQAREISCAERWDWLDKQIRERAHNQMNNLPLNGYFRLSAIDKRMLEDNGYKISEGEGGKCGKFDIIYW